MHQAMFTLRQETPLVHFLHDQPGATLRATELKPKLDRFIVHDFSWAAPEKAKQFAEKIAEIRKNIESEQPKASDYKVRIWVDGNEEPDYYYLESRIKEEDKAFVAKTIESELRLTKVTVFKSSPLFVNNDKRKDKKWSEIRIGVMHRSDIKVMISTWDSDLHELIKEALPLLFCVENFGLRQSKGFGCFTAKDLGGEKIATTMQNYPRFVKRKKIEKRGLEEVFKMIDNTYKDLRNDPGSKASAIRDYFEQMTPSVSWEKNRITPELVHGRAKDPGEVATTQFVRALLGLPQLHDYPHNNVKVNISDKEDEIGRFRSPIRFKVVNGWLYLLEDKFDKTMLNKTFIFYTGNNKGNGIEIKTPSTFNLEEFLDSNLNNWHHV